VTLDRRYCEIIENEIAAHGLRKPDYGIGGRHAYAEFEDALGRRRKLWFPITPSDWRGPMRARSYLRKMLAGGGR
jgi:hypothetical protein